MPGIIKRGFTLLEVLIALLIFSLGLMGLAGLLTTSVKTNHSAYLRTQAIFLAQGMADRMRANPLGLWNSNYNLNTVSTTAGTAPAAATLTATASLQDCTTASCSVANIATRDLQLFQNQLLQFLPNAGVAINCTAVGSPPTAADLLKLPPYAQPCEIQVSWTQLPIAGQSATQAATPDIFDWVFQP